MGINGPGWEPGGTADSDRHTDTDKQATNQYINNKHANHILLEPKTYLARSSLNNSAAMPLTNKLLSTIFMTNYVN